MASSGLYDFLGSDDSDRVLRRIGRLEAIAPQLLPGNKIAAQTIGNSYSPISSSVVNNGVLDITKSASVNFKGAMSPSVIDGQFSIGAPTDPQHSTIYWDGTNSSAQIIIHRADGTAFPVPPNTLTVSGLTASVNYTYMAFWSPGSLCNVGWAQGTVGSPQIAFASTDSASIFAVGQASLTQSGREKLAVFAFTQPASGTSSPGSPTTPPVKQTGMCVMNGTNIEPLGPIDPWDWRTVNTPQTDWYALETKCGLRLNCTGSHPLMTYDYGKRAVEKLKLGDWVITEHGSAKLSRVEPFKRLCVKIQVFMSYGHLYWSNGFLSSNIKNQINQT